MAHTLREFLFLCGQIGILAGRVVLLAGFVGGLAAPWAVLAWK